MATRSKELIVRALVEVIYGSIMPITIWGPLVFTNPKSDLEMQARVAAFPILFSCIRDIVEAGPKHIAPIENEARQAGFGTLAMNAYIFSERCKLALPILKMFSEEEQIHLALLRDRLAHGYLDGTSNKTRSVKITRDGKVVKVKFDRDTLNQIEKKHFPSDNLLDINPMINKVSAAFAEYNSKIEEYDISVPKLTEALMEGGIVIFEKK